MKGNPNGNGYRVSRKKSVVLPPDENFAPRVGEKDLSGLIGQVQLRLGEELGQDLDTSNGNGHPVLPDTVLREGSISLSAEQSVRVIEAIEQIKSKLEHKPKSRAGQLLAILSQ